MLMTFQTRMKLIITFIIIFISLFQVSVLSFSTDDEGFKGNTYFFVRYVQYEDIL
jgi:hypothetical protein